ncbi:MAG: polyprenyl synthetase family protein [Deltaproteobacteria bacterium]|nr:polyprenyl synthetase family protein [Deltaproteobacteria bacterium]MBW2170676.1 polyprenyl synthetase family protein [Deltaproteobacteria bacterium]
MSDLTAYLKAKQQEINAALERFWDGTEPFPTPLIQAMRYSLEAGGKRLRPVLCLAASEAVGGSDADVMPAACALELIHTYSLIHDDLPAMDDDDLRRGKPTCHKAFDEATAILAGDGLLTAAFEVLASAGRARRSDPLKWLEVSYLIARAAGCTGMVQGQMMDLSVEGKAITLEELETLQQLKTGALIEISVKTGALLGGGNPQEVAALTAYGRHIGLAFQLADDILNVEGKPEIIGKPVGSDQAHQKITGPSLIGLEQAKARARELVDSALEELEVFDMRGQPLAALARYIIERKK